ncbi:hypothetical protein H0H93_011947 [Arthromyces matolae]|nr:hypothetical protein H0H93_011947 [Arthromyces matolae]
MTALDAPSNDCSSCASLALAVRSLSAAVEINVEALSMSKEALESLGENSKLWEYLVKYCISHTACGLPPALSQSDGSFSSFKVPSSEVKDDTKSFSSFKVPTLPFSSFKIPSADSVEPIAVFNKDGSFSSFHIHGAEVAGPSDVDAVAGHPGPSDVDDDAKSVKSHVSVSTDWEKEYGVDSSILQAVTLISRSAEPFVGNDPTTTTVDEGATWTRAPRVPSEERCQNVAGNVEGIPSNAWFGCESEEAGRTIFEEALDGGHVVKVTIMTTEKVLSRNDVV